MSRRPRVALVPGRTLEDPTYRRVCDDLSAALRRRGWTARSFCPKRDAPAAGEAFRADVVHLHISGRIPRRTERFVARALRSAGRLVLTFQDLANPDFPRMTAAERLRLRRLARRAHALTALNGELAAAARRALGRPDAAVALVGNGIGAGWFRRARREGGRVVAVARLSPYKGPDLLLWAFRAMLESAPQTRLDLYGQDFQDGHYQGLARLLGLQKRVRFHGRVDTGRLRRALASARLFVSASRSETFGLALMEALAAGVPVVAARTGAAGALLSHGRDGLLFAPGDWRALKNGLLRLWSDAPLRRRLGRAGRRLAERHTWSARAAEYERLYAETAIVLSSKGMAGPKR